MSSPTTPRPAASNVRSSHVALDGFPWPPRPTRRLPRLKHADFHTSWRSEVALLNSTAKRIVAVVALAGLAVLPFLLSGTLLRVAISAGIAAIGAIGLTLVAGVAGQLSLGHAAFLGIGAYTAAYVTGTLGWSFFWALPLAAVVAGIAGLVLAPMALRLRGLYLAVVTLAFVIVMQHVFRNATFLTGGVGGTRITSPSIAGVDFVRGGTLAGIRFAPSVLYYFVVLVVALLVVVATKNLLRSRMGRMFASVRDHDIAAGVVGVNVFAAKTRAFVISSAITGIAGALFGGFIRFTNFEQWNLLLSIDYLAMAIIGGLGTVAGAVMGAVFITFLPQLLDGLSPLLPFLSTEPGIGLTAARFSRILYGVLLAAVMVYEPLGLFGIWRRMKTYFTTWPFSR